MFFQESVSKKKTVEGWVKAYSREFYNYALLRLRKHEEAEDVVQTTFIRAFRSFSSFKQGSSEKAWLYAILGNVIKDVVRQSSTRPQFKVLEEDDELENLLVDGSETPDLVASKKIEYELLASGIANLPEHFAAPLLLREVSDMSYKDIADYLSVPVGTVMSRLSRARKALFDLMTGSSNTQESVQEQRKKNTTIEPDKAGKNLQSKKRGPNEL
ncbi:MAG: sigma-70 family RNA polymerase sigma factor [Candidatus Obscuribacterales bacterium]|jgi:RNA polymerase sigma-70 factor (ECF subfamily)